MHRLLLHRPNYCPPFLSAALEGLTTSARASFPHVLTLTIFDDHGRKLSSLAPQRNQCVGQGGPRRNCHYRLIPFSSTSALNKTIAEKWGWKLYPKSPFNFVIIVFLKTQLFLFLINKASAQRRLWSSNTTHWSRIIPYLTSARNKTVVEKCNRKLYHKSPFNIINFKGSS